jgi:hypothetical protein
MTLDNTLNANAVKCAQYYAQKKTIDHSCPYKNGGNRSPAQAGARAGSETGSSEGGDWPRR